MTSQSLRRLTSHLLAIATCTSSASWANANALRLDAGAYEVFVHLELPHVEEKGAQKTKSICVTTSGDIAGHGLAVLSDNNPLAHCPISNVHDDGGTLTFDIICPGGNAAIASAKFKLSVQSFEGRITMKMGGKNMTMTESQVGRRTGACPMVPPHP